MERDRNMYANVNSPCAYAQQGYVFGRVGLCTVGVVIYAGIIFMLIMLAMQITHK